MTSVGRNGHVSALCQVARKDKDRIHNNIRLLYIKKWCKHSKTILDILLVEFCFVG